MTHFKDTEQLARAGNGAGCSIAPIMRPPVPWPSTLPAGDPVEHGDPVHGGADLVEEIEPVLA